MNLLLTSISSKIKLVQLFKLAAENWGVGVYGCDVQDDTPARKYVDKFLVIKPMAGIDFINGLIDQCRVNEINLIIPTCEEEIIIFAAYHNNFINAGIRVIVPEIDTVQICQNKLFFNDWLFRKGFPAQKIHDIATVKESDFPLFFKPVVGPVSKKCRILKSMDDLTGLQDEIITDFIDAPEYSIDVLMDLQGKPVQAVVCSLDKTVDGIAVKSKIVDHKKLADAALKISTDLHLVGHNLLQAFELENGDFVFFDVNLRFGDGSDLSINAGLQSPDRLLAMVYGSLKDKKRAKKPYEISQDMRHDYDAKTSCILTEN